MVYQSSQVFEAVVIKSEDVYAAVEKHVSDGKKISYADLSKFINERFHANSNQISGLIHRMHAHKKILTKLKNEKAMYVKYTEDLSNPTFMVELNDDVNKLINKIQKSLANNVLTLTADEVFKTKKLLEALEEAGSNL